MATKKHQFKTTNIRGKQYVEVNERIKFFRNENQYKNWTISTDVTMTDDRKECICKCTIADTERPQWAALLPCLGLVSTPRLHQPMK